MRINILNPWARMAVDIVSSCPPANRRTASRLTACKFLRQFFKSTSSPQRSSPTSRAGYQKNPSVESKAPLMSKSPKQISALRLAVRKFGFRRAGGVSGSCRQSRLFDRIRSGNTTAGVPKSVLTHPCVPFISLILALISTLAGAANY